MKIKSKWRYLWPLAWSDLQDQPSWQAFRQQERTDILRVVLWLRVPQPMRRLWRCLQTGEQKGQLSKWAFVEIYKRVSLRADPALQWGVWGKAFCTEEETTVLWRTSGSFLRVRIWHDLPITFYFLRWKNEHIRCNSQAANLCKVVSAYLTFRLIFFKRSRSCLLSSSVLIYHAHSRLGNSRQQENKFIS